MLLSNKCRFNPEKNAFSYWHIFSLNVISEQFLNVFYLESRTVSFIPSFGPTLDPLGI